MRFMTTLKGIALGAALAMAGGAAFALDARDGWSVQPTAKSYKDLLADLKAAVKAEKMGVVTEAGPTERAKELFNEVIPGNRVVGVFRPDFAVRALRASEAAMIEAPIRFYVTEQPDGAATLSYKTPSFVFAPYMEEGGEELKKVASELDVIFQAIAERAVK